MSSFEKDLEEITNSEQTSIFEEFKIVTSIYLRNRLLEASRKEISSKIAEHMKIAENTANAYLSGTISGRLYENSPGIYFKIMKTLLDKFDAPEYMTALMNQIKKQPRQKRKFAQPETSISEFETPNENKSPKEEIKVTPGYEIKSTERKKLKDGSTIQETILENGVKYHTTTSPSGEITNQTYHPKTGWTFGPHF